MQASEHTAINSPLKNLILATPEGPLGKGGGLI